MCGNFSRRRQTSGDGTLAGFCLAPSDRKTPPWIWWRNCESTLPNIEIGPRGRTTPGPPLPPRDKECTATTYCIYAHTQRNLTAQAKSKVLSGSPVRILYLLWQKLLIQSPLKLGLISEKKWVFLDNDLATSRNNSVNCTSWSWATSKNTTNKISNPKILLCWTSPRQVGLRPRPGRNSRIE